MKNYEKYKEMIENMKILENVRKSIKIMKNLQRS